MRRREYLVRLRDSVRAWNDWRHKNPTSSIDLSGADLSERKLSGAHLAGVDLSGADLGNADLAGADLSDAILADANLAGARLTECILHRTVCAQATLMRADLSGASLAFADLARRSRPVNLRSAQLSGADLRSASLHGADLVGAILSDSDLSYADFSATDLRGTTISRCIAERLDLTKAKLGFGIVSSVHLSTALGLDSIEHLGPTSLSTDTLFSPSTPLPDYFLLRCGIPRSLLAFTRDAASLLAVASDHSCFISHSAADRDFASCLCHDLRTSGVRCWFAPDDLRIGDHLRRRTYEAIQGHDRLLVVLSSVSLNDIVVEREVEVAFEREIKEKREVLFPISIDEALTDSEVSWASDIRRTRHIGNFCNWRNRTSYDKALRKLLSDLGGKPVYT
jgi:uncharacterized protein YjbI with pentapeptide repeats